MRLHRFILNAPLASSMRVRDPNLVKQLRSVLRLGKGDKIIVCDGSNHEAEAAITSIERDRVELSLSAIDRNTAEPVRKVILYLSVLKSGHVDLALEKATECGVSEIVPVISERTVKRGVKLDRLRTIVKEAAEQSGRGRVPLIHEEKLFGDALLHAELAASHTFLMHQDGEPFDRVLGILPKDASVGIFIGPEGGWTVPEIMAVRKRSLEGKPITIATMGARVLRAETAVIVATYLATAE